MADYKELNFEDLSLRFDFLPQFENTLEISPFKDIIGQDRAVEAINLGIKMDKSGYNIFVAGNNGTGKKGYVMEKLKQYASGMPTPDDWCYVYNFNDNLKPMALSLNPGTVDEFKSDIDEFIDSLYDEVPRFFSNELYEKERSQTMDRYQKEIVHLADKLFEESREKGFSVKSTGEGFAFIPLKNGEEMSERQYNELNEEEKQNINNSVSELKLVALETIRKTKALKKQMAEELQSLDNEISKIIINNKLNNLKDKYGNNNKILDYLDDLRNDIIGNIDAFMEYDEQNDKFDESFYKRYSVNVIVSNAENEGAPVIYEDTPEYHNLLGIVEYENKLGTLVTDFTMIQPGSLHRANGGFIVIETFELLKSYHGWEALKRCLKSGSICIENLKNQFDIIPIATLKPQDIELNVKVILLGSYYLYYLLYNYDEDFKEIFKIKADFENEIKNDSATIIEFIGFISNYCSKNNILPVTRSGVMEILKYSLRLQESKKYFTASMRDIVDVIDQADIAARSDEKKCIEALHIKRVISSRERRYSIIKDRILDLYRDNKYVIDLSGYKIGEINALSVIDYGDYAFGKQNKITVTTFAGRDGIINIERETELSGNIHSKGIMILSGYIGEKFGQNMPLSFNASICFEQLYGGIDGDSASAAELICLMSSLGDIPINQSIAITGSVNQRGEIQPVGGLIEKIEGYYDICKLFGLNGRHGVIIPNTNIDDIILKDEILDSVDKKLFHVFAVNKIEDCFEILCPENLHRDGKRKVIEFIEESIMKKLEKYKNAFLEKGKK